MSQIWLKSWVEVVMGDTREDYAGSGRVNRVKAHSSGSKRRNLSSIAAAGRGKELALTASRGGHGKVVHPNQVIPMDEDEFKDF